MPRVSCPLCGGRRPEFVRALENRDPATERAFPSVSLSVCRDCGLIHQNPRVSRPQMTRLYARLEDKAGGGVTAAESADRLKALRRLRPAPARVLEVGCSDGAFLELARAAGYAVTGLEPSAPNLAKARRRGGLDLRRGFLEDFESSERFDVICHFYVLEYSFEPLAFLAAARRLLAPGGVMLLEVPDAAAFARLPFANSLVTHQDIVVFTRETLDAALKASGFAPLRGPLGAATKSYGLRAAARLAAPRASRGRPGRGRAALRRWLAKRDRMLGRVESRAARWAAGLAGRPGPVVVFGAGENGRLVARTALGRGGRELLFCDSSAALEGRRVEGRRVVPPARVPALKPALVVAASIDYQDDMVRVMRGLGVPAGRVVKMYQGF